MSVMKQKDYADFIVPVNSAEESNTQRAESKFNLSGRVQHSKELADDIKNLLMNETCSDVTLVVDDVRFPAHKVILAARSKYFWGMFFGGMRESKSSEVYLHDTSAEPFRALLKYVYCGEIELNTLSFELVIDVLGLVHKYSFGDLENAIAEYLKSVLTAENVCMIYAAAYLYSMNNLIAFCVDYCDENATQTLNSPEFNQLSVNALSYLIGRNSFCAPELEIFHAVRRWIEMNEKEISSSDRSRVIKNIRLALIKLDDLLNVVRPSGLIPPDDLLDVITEQTSKRNSDQTKRRTSEMGHRGFLVSNTNVATLKKDAKVLSGNCSKPNECNGDRILLDTSSTTAPSRIIIELQRCYIINHIMFLLTDQFSYYIEVSVDNEDWIRVIDHTNYLCRSRQRLYFNERVVKYIRFVGIPNVGNIPLILSDFEASYSTEPFEVDSATTLLIPRHNVATTRNNAIVIEGVSRIRNSLLNGEVQSYDWDYGYTCHELGSSSIIVQLPQPYLIDSARLLLWDCDERRYSYYIEVSCDKVTWTKVCQVVNERSWQTLRFNRIPVVFVKIVGTYNSANDVFHCVHFECPAISETIAPENSDEMTVSIVADNKRPSDRPCTSKEAGL